MIRKQKIRRSTQFFFNMWGDSYERTVVFLDTYYANVLFESTALFTYKRVQDMTMSMPIKYYPLPAAPTIEALDIYSNGVVVGHRRNFFWIRGFEILDSSTYNRLKLH